MQILKERLMNIADTWILLKALAELWGEETLLAEPLLLQGNIPGMNHTLVKALTGCHTKV